MIINRYCEICNKETTHDFSQDIKDDTKTTIMVCQNCGETSVDIDPIDNCDICQHHECFDCPLVNPIID